MVVVVAVAARQRCEVDATEGQLQFRYVDAPVAVHVQRLHQRLHFPRR